MPDPWRPKPFPPEPLEGTPAKIVADGVGGKAGAETQYSGANRWSSPGYGPLVDGKIDRFKGKFVWRGTIEIQTLYARGVKPDAYSCYGRGTAVGDVRAGNVTLGFHEACHRDDFVAYLKTHPLPDPPPLAVGMTEAQFRQALGDFQEAFNTYFQDMEHDSFTRTDEVGHAKSTWQRTGVCYGHRAPGP